MKLAYTYLPRSINLHLVHVKISINKVTLSLTTMDVVLLLRVLHGGRRKFLMLLEKPTDWLMRRIETFISGWALEQKVNQIYRVFGIILPCLISRYVRWMNLLWTRKLQPDRPIKISTRLSYRSFLIHYFFNYPIITSVCLFIIHVSFKHIWIFDWLCCRM